MAFKPSSIPLSPESRERIDATSREMKRLYALPDRWLGEELLRLARRARKEYPSLLGNPCTSVYDPNFVWHVVPRIAKELGVKNLGPNENINPRVAQAEGQELRDLVGGYLKNLSLDKLAPEAAAVPADRSKPTACELLAHDFVNGNPVAIALDRLVPPPALGQDKNDWVARHTREVSRVRGHSPVMASWSPAFQAIPRYEHDNEGPSL